MKSILGPCLVNRVTIRQQAALFHAHTCTVGHVDLSVHKKFAEMTIFSFTYGDMTIKINSISQTYVHLVVYFAMTEHDMWNGILYTEAIVCICVINRLKR